jgi:hypothetical protein
MEGCYQLCPIGGTLPGVEYKRKDTPSCQLHREGRVNQSVYKEKDGTSFLLHEEGRYELSFVRGRVLPLLELSVCPANTVQFLLSTYVDLPFIAREQAACAPPAPRIKFHLARGKKFIFIIQGRTYAHSRARPEIRTQQALWGGGGVGDGGGSGQQGGGAPQDPPPPRPF